MRYSILLLVWLFGCQGLDVGPRTSIILSNYNDIVNEVIVEWQEDNSLPKYVCDIGELYVATPTNEQFTIASYNSYCTPDALYVCEKPIVSAYTLREGIRTKYIIVLAAVLNQEERESAIAHESLHWLSFCTGHTETTPEDFAGYPFYNGDAGHNDPRLWGPDGILRHVGY